MRSERVAVMKKIIFAFVLGVTITIAGAARAALVLYGRAGSNLFSVDETTGAASLVGPLVNVNILDTLAALDPVEVPELSSVPLPATLPLFLSALAWLVFLRRRRAV